MIREVLLVDDEGIILLSFKQQLTKRGFVVFTARNGNEGIAVFRANPGITTVVSDLNMSRGSGEVLHRGIAEELAARRGRFIIMSGSGDLGLPPYFRDKGLEMVNKPVHMERFLQLLGNPGEGPS